MQQASKLCQEIYSKLQQEFSPEHLVVEDESHLHAGHHGVKGIILDTTHVKIIISAPCFASLTKVQAHRAINTSLKFAFDQGLHALSIKV